MVPPASVRCDVCGELNPGTVFLCQACNHSFLPQIPTVSTPLLLNRIFQERYQVIGQVGSGGFASVYKAIDMWKTSMPVAIKEVSLRRLDWQAAQDATDAFHREVGFLSRLTHVGLPRVHETCKDSEHFYLVMDFIEGETLETYQARLQVQQKALPLSEVFAIGIQLCTVLDYLHTQEPPIVFRDLKPSNIMRTPQGQLRLIDFGIARHFKPGQSRDTVALGSLGYAAPEQYGKAQTTPLADIYSLGAVLHQLISGHDPSEAPFRFAPLRIDSYSGLSKLGTLIAQMVEMEGSKRPASIAVIKQELQYIANIWRASILHFWRPGPEHSNMRVTGAAPYAAGYRGAKQEAN